MQMFDLLLLLLWSVGEQPERGQGLQGQGYRNKQWTLNEDEIDLTCVHRWSCYVFLLHSAEMKIQLKLWTSAKNYDNLLNSYD